MYKLAAIGLSLIEIEEELPKKRCGHPIDYGVVFNNTLPKFWFSL